MLDIRGFGYSMSLRKSMVVSLIILMCITGLIILGSLMAYNMNQRFYFDITIMKVFLDWHAVYAWTAWVLCLTWGWIAVSLPARPREPKKAALIAFVIMLLVHATFHCIWAFVLVRRCYFFYQNMLLGNLLQEGSDVVLEKFHNKKFVDDMLSVVGPVLNWVATPYVFRLLQKYPPLDVIFFLGWNNVVVIFAIAVIPVIIILGTIPLVIAYRYAVSMGGNGTEMCPPSQISLFYSLSKADRSDIRNKLRKIEDFKLLDENQHLVQPEESSSDSFNEHDGGGTHEEYQPKRIMRV